MVEMFCCSVVLVMEKVKVETPGGTFRTFIVITINNLGDICGTYTTSSSHSVWCTMIRSRGESTCVFPAQVVMSSNKFCSGTVYVCPGQTAERLILIFSGFLKKCYSVFPQIHKVFFFGVKDVYQGFTVSNVP